MTLFDDAPEPPEPIENPYPPEPPYPDDDPPHVSLTVPRGDNPPTPFDRGMAGSARASRRWTLEELDAVDRAIEQVARRLELFTSDDVWAELGAEFPVTKGLASRLNRARRLGTITNTGETRIARRGGDHDKGQRLSLWRSLASAAS